MAFLRGNQAYQQWKLLEPRLAVGVSHPSKLQSALAVVQYVINSSDDHVLRSMQHQITIIATASVSSAKFKAK